MARRTQVAAAVSVVCSVMAGPAIAQDSAGQDVVEEIVVFGIRSSLTSAMDIKRDSTGVVDAMSAENIGKFPDSNLAESLQRITGVSIDRVEGEGSNVTVRGVGGQFNLVTLNGRQMPAANVQNVGSGQLFAVGDSRSFDFSVLASEGVSGLQVYKTGRASAPSGGMGATINVETVRPLRSGTRAAISGKLVDDAGSESGDLTPELSGLASWANDERTIGVSVFASYQERDSSVRGGRFGCCFGYYPYDPDDRAVVNAENVNEPEPGSLAGIPSNVRIEYATTHRERSNAMLTLQFAPTDRIALTADALYTVLDLDHNSTYDQQYFSSNFSYLEWDGSDVAATPLSLVDPYADEVASFTATGSDILHDNIWIRQRDEMKSVGLNLEYAYNDDLSFQLDLATSMSQSGGNWPGGWSVYRTAIAGAVSGWRAVDLRDGIPRALVAITDGLGDQDGIYEASDVGSQNFQRSFSEQRHDLDQLQLSGSWDNGGNISVDFGVGRIESAMNQISQRHVDEMGGWGVADTGDIDRLAPGSITTLCLSCKFRDANVDASYLASLAPDGASLMTLGEISMWVNPHDLQYAFDGYVNYRGRVYDADNPSFRDLAKNLITEDTSSAYVQATMDGTIGYRPVQIVAGLRWESTDVLSETAQTVPIAIIHTGPDSDDVEFSPDANDVIAETHSYHNLLPNLDFSIDLTDEFKLRASFSKTLGRPPYSAMFVPTSIGGQDGWTYFGGIRYASKGTAELDALESANFDLSLEYYYGESSYAAIGYFDKAVSNFITVEQIRKPLFSLRDITTGQPGTRSGDAIAALDAGNWPVTQSSIFTMMAILDNPQDFPNGAAEYDGSSEQAETIEVSYEIWPVSTDPLYLFQINQPQNSKTFNLEGWELAWQHFFGESGFGFLANLTLVSGDIKYNNGLPPVIEQFALEGLSDSANLVLIWENEEFGARLAYNWRDEFLDQVAYNSFSPLYYDPHEQLDVNLSWNVSDQFSLSLDGINITEEGISGHGRTENMHLFAKEYDARWVLAASYRF